MQERSVPEFSLPRWGGGEWSWRKGQAQSQVLAFFFEVECPTCQLAAPYVERLHRALGGQGVEVIGIAQNTAEEVEPWVEEYGLSFPILLEPPPYPVSRSFHVEAVPHLIWITPQGTIEETLVGFSRQGLQTLAERLAERTGQSAPALFPEGDPAPSWRPGCVSKSADP